jgi:hypothetical protein
LALGGDDHGGGGKHDHRERSSGGMVDDQTSYPVVIMSPSGHGRMRGFLAAASRSEAKLNLPGATASEERKLSP